MRIVFACALAAACSGRVPETRYYALAEPPARPHGGQLVLALEPLETDPAYDDERIVYRTSPYRFDYYHYHRWSAAPGTLIGNYLERALEQSGRFQAVVHEVSPDTQVVLGGRVVAIEEVDASRSRWLGHLVLELTLTDAHTGDVLWTQQYDETVPLTQQSPEGLARAISIAMQRIVARATPAIADVTRQRIARAASH